MQPRDRLDDDRAISPVIGVVLLVAIAVASSALVATAVLGGDFLDDSPSAELVYAEKDPGEVIVAVKEVSGLTRGGTEIRLAGGGDCGVWGGSGDLEPGDTLRLNGTDCTESLDEGDVLQIVGGSTLVDTYELQGVSPSVPFSVEINDTNDPVIPDDDEDLEVEVNVTNTGNETADEEVTVRVTDLDDGSELGVKSHEEEIDPGNNETYTFTFNATEDDIGAYEVSAVGSSDVDVEEVAIADYGCEEFEDDFDDGDEIEIDDDEVVACDFVADDGSPLDNDLTIDGTLVGSAKVTGLIEFRKDSDGEGAIIGNITADGNNVKVNAGSSITGSITNVDGGRDVIFETGETTEVHGNVSSARNVDIKDSHVINGTVILTGSEDWVELQKSAKITGDVNADDNDVTLKDDATIEGDVVGDEVTCEGDSSIEGSIDADTVDGC